MPKKPKQRLLEFVPTTYSGKTGTEVLADIDKKKEKLGLVPTK